MMKGLLDSHPVLKGIDVLSENLEEVMIKRMVWAPPC